MIYGCYLEAYTNGIYLRHKIEAKTMQWVKRKRKDYLESNRAVELGYVYYSYAGNNEYRKSSYTVLDRFNCKAFFDFWA
jgi:hypothetical protein